MVSWQFKFLFHWNSLVSLDTEVCVFTNQDFQTKAAGVGNESSVSR